MSAKRFPYVCSALLCLALPFGFISCAESDLAYAVEQRDAPGYAEAQVVTVFRGRPTMKVSEAGASRVAEKVSRESAINLECVISKIGEDFYWASRENKRMVRIEAGAFHTYVAADGSGYVRTFIPGYKPAPAETEKTFDYVEHLLTGLGSVTYWGAVRP